MRRPSGRSNGKFFVHMNEGVPTAATMIDLPARLGPFCFPVLIPPFGNAAPIAIWNNVGKETKIGGSHFRGVPIGDPERAPSMFFEATVAGNVFPPGSSATLQGAIINQAASGPKPVSVTNAIAFLVY